MTPTAILATVRLVPVSCYKCGVWFGMDSEHNATAVRLGPQITFYCPNGHGQSYTEGEAGRLRDELARQKHQTEQAKADRDWWQGRAKTLQAVGESTERRLRAHKGVVTKLKKRVSKGVCPCCHQKFKDLRDHMAAQHPDWNPEQGAEALASKSKE